MDILFWVIFWRRLKVRAPWLKNDFFQLQCAFSVVEDEKVLQIKAIRQVQEKALKDNTYNTIQYNEIVIHCNKMATYQNRTSTKNNTDAIQNSEHTTWYDEV